MKPRIQNTIASLLPAQSRLILPILAVVLAVAFVAPAANGIAASYEKSVVPAQLVGVWTRTVREADAQHAGAGQGFVGDHCRLTIRRTGKDNASVFLAPGSELAGGIVSAGAGRVHINLGSPTVSVYRWKVTGRLLTLTKIRDDAPDRVAVFAGVWKRK